VLLSFAKIVPQNTLQNYFKNLQYTSKTSGYYHSYNIKE